MKYVDDRKAAHLAAFFLRKGGGRLSVLKLVKLMYLAEREHMKRYLHPITLDHFVSMPHGPVPTAVYDILNGCLDSEEWRRLISERQGNEVVLRSGVKEEDLDELSDLEVETAERVWREFGKMDPWELRNWTHEHCPEWEDPDGSSYAIPYARILRVAAGLDGSQAEDVARELEALRASMFEGE